MRVVITCPEKGIYLGSFWGLGFWSLLDCVSQDSVVTFSDTTDAIDYIESWVENNNPTDYLLMQVDTNEKYATVEDLKNAGLTHLLGDLGSVTI